MMMDGKRMVIGIERWRDGKMVSMMGLMKVLDRYYKLKGKSHQPPDHQSRWKKSLGKRLLLSIEGGEI